MLVVLGVILLAGYLMLGKKAGTGVNSQTSGIPPDLNAFTQCLTDKGVKEYGSYICSACKAQAKLFGESNKFVEYIECHPNGPNPQTELCLKQAVSKTPTWTLEKDGEVTKRLEGFQPLEDLASFSGCTL